VTSGAALIGKSLDSTSFTRGATHQHRSVHEGGASAVLTDSLLFGEHRCLLCLRLFFCLYSCSVCDCFSACIPVLFAIVFLLVFLFCLGLLFGCSAYFSRDQPTLRMILIELWICAAGTLCFTRWS
jgi:hypothetical protein